VYYAHRIWPKENPGPKPPFEKMILHAQVEAKVEDYLKKSAALEKFLLQNFYLHKSVTKTARQIEDWLGKLFEKFSFGVRRQVNVIPAVNSPTKRMSEFVICHNYTFTGTASCLTT
jgi:hypothetical protein